ncbi:MAG: hypothetical protein VKP72_06905 [bacterium]|nr:hypothetical protein [bacterium]
MSLASGDTVIASTSLTPGVATWDPGVAPGATLSLEVRAHDERRLVAVATASVVPADGSRPSVNLAFQPTVWMVAGTDRSVETFTEGQQALVTPLPRITHLLSGTRDTLVLGACTRQSSWFRFLTLGPDGRLMSIAGNGNSPGVMPEEASAREVALKVPTYVTLGPDGNLWFQVPDQGLFRLTTGTGTSSRWPNLPPGTLRRELQQLPGGHSLEGLAAMPDGSLVIVAADPDYSYSTIWRANPVPGATMDLQPWFGGHPLTDRDPREGDDVSTLLSFYGGEPVVAPDGGILLRGYSPEALWYLPATDGPAFGRPMRAGHLHDLRPALRQALPPVDPGFSSFEGPIAFARDGSLLITSNIDSVILRLDRQTGQVSTLLGDPGKVRTLLPISGTLARSQRLSFVYNLTVKLDGRVFVLDGNPASLYELAL